VKTIFVAFPTMHDSEATDTIKDIFENAEHPERINLSVYNLYINESNNTELMILKVKYGFKLYHQYIINSNYLNVIGMTKGRAFANSAYTNEDYILQIDSHTKFAKNWDTKLINLYEKIELDKPIMTAFASFYDSETRNWDTRNKYFVYPFYHICKCDDCKYSDKPWLPNWDLSYSLNDFNEKYKEEFYPCVKFNNQFAFSKYPFIKDKENNQLGVGEDVIQSIELFKKGYQFVYPNVKESVIGHSWMSNKRPRRASLIGDRENQAIEDIGKEISKAYILFNKEAVKKYAEYSGLEIYNDNELHVKMEYKVPKDYQ